MSDKSKVIKSLTKLRRIRTLLNVVMILIISYFIYSDSFNGVIIPFYFLKSLVSITIIVYMISLTGTTLKKSNKFLTYFRNAVSIAIWCLYCYVGGLYFVFFGIDIIILITGILILTGVELANKKNNEQVKDN